MAEQTTKVQERGVTYTEGPEGPSTTQESSGTFTSEPATSFGSAYDSKKTKIKSVRNWQPDIDGNDVTLSYTTGF